jgi:pimeloyl-ACP methyl ester carboxylesterase
LIVTGLYVVCLVALTLAQRRLMYFPCFTSPRDLQKTAAKEGFSTWLNSRGESIGWHRPAKSPAKRCILVLHGNAGCATDRIPYADAFQAVEPIDFYILEYPGYGGRRGSPSQATILRAAEEALNNIPKQCSVFVVAESLGTGPAAWLAGTHPEQVSGLFLIAPYNSMAAVAQKHMPLFPVKAMLRDRYPSSTWLEQYRGPVAVLLAGKDEVVPTELGRDLFESYRGPKKLWIEPDAGHNDVHQPDSAVWREVVEFWNGAAQPQ